MIRGFVFGYLLFFVFACAHNDSWMCTQGNNGDLECNRQEEMSR